MSEIESFSTTYNLSNCGEEKWYFTPFLWVVTGHCLRAGILESCYFFVLRLIRVKFYIRTWLIESFPMAYRLSSSGEEKWFTPFCGWFQAAAFVLDLWKAVTFVLRPMWVKFHIRTRLIPLCFKSSCFKTVLIGF